MKILIADDHVLIRDGVKHTLEQLGDGVIYYEAACGEEVEALIKSHEDIEVVLLDLYMPNTNGFELILKLHTHSPGLPIIVLSASEDQATMKRALDCGASGFIPKSTSHDVMISALNLVLSGGIYVPASLISCGSAISGKIPNEISAALHSTKDVTGMLSSLTERQRDVLELMVHGLPNKDIARQLNLSENTIKIHVTAILKTLDVSNRTQAVLVAQSYLNSTSDHAVTE